MSYCPSNYRIQRKNAAPVEREVQDPVERQEEKDLRAPEARTEAVDVGLRAELPDRVLLADVQAEHRQARQECRRVGQKEDGKRDARLS